MAQRKRASKGKATINKVAALKLKRMTLSSLKPHPRNDEIRNHPEEGSAEWKTLSRSLDHDYFDPLVYNQRNGYLVSGHLRLKVMLSDGFTHADVSVVDYDEHTHMARMLAANNNLGEADFEGMEIFFEELNMGKDFDMALTGFTEFGNFSDGENEEEEYEHGEEEEVYTKAIVPPTYTPTKAKAPPIKELASLEKFNSLTERIDKNKKLTPKVREFLKMAAYRHVVFDYEQIAEFYCHADKDTQSLMEDSALVIIDFDKAIEEGYVHLSDELKKEYGRQKEMPYSDEGE